MAMVTTNSLLTVHEAAERLKVSADTIRRWHKKGLIRAQVGEHGERRFGHQELERLRSKSGSSSHEWKMLEASRTNISLIELFSGSGGLALGLHNAGLVNKLLVDFDKDCVNTLKLNRPKWNALCSSVTDIDLSDYEDQIDVMAGGFPCQAFSSAGNKRGFEDTRGTLFYDYARLIDQVKPKIVLGENVRGLVNHENGKTLAVMVRVLRNLGYRVHYTVLRAQFLDVPQKRERLIILGVRNDLDLPVLAPAEKDYTISLRAALKGVPKSHGMTYSAEKERLMEMIPPGGYWKDLPREIQMKFMGASYFLGGGKTGMARRLHWDEPSLTLTCNPAQKQTERCHPHETRPLTVREYARIQGFPDDWEFTGSLSSQYKQIGNAVPVNLGYHVGLAIRAMLGKPARRAADPAALISLSESEQLRLPI